MILKELFDKKNNKQLKEKLDALKKENEKLKDQYEKEVLSVRRQTNINDSYRLSPMMFLTPPDINKGNFYGRNLDYVLENSDMTFQAGHQKNIYIKTMIDNERELGAFHRFINGNILPNEEEYILYEYHTRPEKTATYEMVVMVRDIVYEEGAYYATLEDLFGREKIEIDKRVDEKLLVEILHKFIHVHIWQKNCYKKVITQIDEVIDQTFYDYEGE